MTYAAPLADMRFVLEEVAGIDELAALPGYRGSYPRSCRSGARAGCKVCGRRIGAAEPAGGPHRQRPRKRCRAHPARISRSLCPICRGRVGRAHRRPRIWRARAALGARGAGERDVELGLHGFALCPLLNMAAIELLQAYGCEEQKRRYLGKLVSGEWTGTMNLTEPQAGSDLGALTTRAVRPRPQGRSLPDHRPEDLHHLWRPRPGAEHRPCGAGAHA